MPIKRYPVGDVDQDDALTKAGEAPELPTEVVSPTTPPTDVGPTAWAEVGDDSLDDSSNLDDRRPLSVALMALLAGVVIGWIGLGAYMIGEHVSHRSEGVNESLPPSRTVQIPSNVAKPTTTATPTPALKIQPNAWEVFTYLLRARGG